MLDFHSSSGCWFRRMSVPCNNTCFEHIVINPFFYLGNSNEICAVPKNPLVLGVPFHLHNLWTDQLTIKIKVCSGPHNTGDRSNCGPRGNESATIDLNAFIIHTKRKWRHLWWLYGSVSESKVMHSTTAGDVVIPSHLWWQWDHMDSRRLGRCWSRLLGRIKWIIPSRQIKEGSAIKLWHWDKEKWRRKRVWVWIWWEYEKNTIKNNLKVEENWGTKIRKKTHWMA